MESASIHYHSTTQHCFQKTVAPIQLSRRLKTGISQNALQIPKNLLIRSGPELTDRPVFTPDHLRNDAIMQVNELYNRAGELISAVTPAELTPCFCKTVCTRAMELAPRCQASKREQSGNDVFL